MPNEELEDSVPLPEQGQKPACEGTHHILGDGCADCREFAEQGQMCPTCGSSKRERDTGISWCCSDPWHVELDRPSPAQPQQEQFVEVLSDGTIVPVDFTPKRTNIVDRTGEFEPSLENIQYAEYVLNHYSKDHRDVLCLARDFDRRSAQLAESVASPLREQIAKLRATMGLDRYPQFESMLECGQALIDQKAEIAKLKAELSALRSQEGQ